MDNLINSITSTSDSGITLTLSMAIVAMAAALMKNLMNEFQIPKAFRKATTVLPNLFLFP